MYDDIIKQWRLLGYTQEQAEWLADNVGKKQVVPFENVFDIDIEEFITILEEFEEGD